MKGSLQKEEAPQKFVAKIEYDHKICKVKKIYLPIGGGRAQVISSTFDEAKAISKARKRKERQESVSSLYQERKVIRSNSEERPVPIKCSEDKNNSIRRVSSSGDFPRSISDEKISSSSQRHDHLDKNVALDDHEYDKRRSHERFARPHTLKSKKHPNKRFKMRYTSKVKIKSDGQNEKDVSKRNSSSSIPAQNLKQHSNVESKENEGPNSMSFLTLRPPDNDYVPSPTHTPISPLLDFSTLHEQVECSEPLLSRPNNHVDEDTETLPSISVASNRMLSSPRNSIIATHRIYLDPDIPQTTISLEKTTQSPVDERMQKLSKQINSYKKKIKVYEADFEVKNGFKPSQIDKLNDTIMRKLYVELSKLKKEHKQLSEISVSCSLMNFSGKIMESGRPVTLEETVQEIEQKLEQKRDSASRDVNIENMTGEQLVEEKIAMQKALLFLESIHGRPQNKEDRDIVRPFYDRYRILKRMVSKTCNMGASGELATIHENETMHFVTPTSSSNDTESEQTEKPAKSTSTDSDTDTPVDGNLHSLSKPELMEQLKVVSEEKKELRRKIKEWELNVQMKTSRMLNKEDKKPMEGTYAAYKKAKGRLRLLEALVAKNNQ